MKRLLTLLSLLAAPAWAQQGGIPTTFKNAGANVSTGFCINSTTSSFTAAGSCVNLASGSGTVTSVTATSPLASSGGATPNISLTGLVPIANGGTAAATTSQNFAFIGPTAGAGAPSFRALVAGDLPAGTGTVTNVTATLPATSTGGATPDIGITSNPGFTGTATFTIGVDKAAAGTFQVGAVTATGITLGGSGVNTTVGGAILTGGVVDRSSSAALGLGTINASSVGIGSSAVTTTINGNLAQPTGKTYVVGANTLVTSDLLNVANATGTLAVANGGSGAATFTANGILFGNGTSAFGVTAAGTNGQVIIGNTGAAPSYTNTPAISPASFAIASQAAGDMFYATSSSAWTRLAIASGSKLLYANATLPAWTTSTFPVGAITSGSIIVATGTNAVGQLLDVAAGSYVRSGGVGIPVVWSTLLLANSGTAGALAAMTATNTMGEITDVATGSVLASGGVGVIPAWTTGPTLTSIVGASNALTISANVTLGANDSLTATAGSAGLDWSAATGNMQIGAATAKLVFFGGTPQSQYGTTGTTAGFTANASANTVYNESTFDGGVGGNAYTISDIVKALKAYKLMQ